MRIAILGAGLCGLATAWHLSQLSDSDHQITIYSPGGIGKGASGVAAGLLHPYAGAHSKKNWRSEEGMLATKKLLNISTEALGEPVASYSGILRPATTEQQIDDFKKCAMSNLDVHWQTLEECQEIPGYIHSPGLFIESGIIVDCPKYLQGLWLACLRNGVKLEPIAISSLQSLDDMDVIVVAMGADSSTFSELAHLNIKSLKGQILEFSWPSNLPVLPYPLNSHAYLIMQPNTNSCIVGSTFERQFSSADPDPTTAKKEILPKLQAFFSGLSTNEPIDCRSGIRAEMGNRRPLVSQISKKCCVITGMGSKGLLYHALCAEELCNSIQSFQH